MATEHLLPNSTVDYGASIRSLWYADGGTQGDESASHTEIDDGFGTPDDDTNYNALSFPPPASEPEITDVNHYRVGLAAPSFPVDVLQTHKIHARAKVVAGVSVGDFTVKLVNKTTPSTVYATLTVAALTGSYVDYEQTLTDPQKADIEADNAWGDLALEIEGAASSGEFRHTSSSFEYTIQEDPPPPGSGARSLQPQKGCSY